MTNPGAGEPARRPLIVGIAGSTRPGSSTERAMRVSLLAAEAAGAETLLFDGAFLTRLPLYAPENPARNDAQRALVDAVRRCDGILVGSPGYHGSVSGLIKNALDQLEDLNRDERPYLDGRAFGCIVTAHGWQACGTTLMALRSIAHALRAWPTPLGVMLNTTTPLFDAQGACVDEKSASQLDLVARQVVEFATLRATHASRPV